jgi:hypothetical protein
VKIVFAIIVAVGALLTAPAFAQEKPADAKTSASTPPQSADAAPQISAQDKQTMNDLQLRAFGYAQSIATLQKELDAVNAEFGRTVQRLQAAQPGYDLTPFLTYVRKSAETSPPVKKDKETGAPKGGGV